MSSMAVGCRPLEVAGEVTLTGVDCAHRYSPPGLLHGEPEVAVIRDDDGSVYCATEDVNENLEDPRGS